MTFRKLFWNASKKSSKSGYANKECGVRDLVAEIKKLMNDKSHLKKILKKGGIVNLKTDSEFLHGYTLGLIEAMGITPIFSNHDIYSNNNAPKEALEIQTFYEKKFLDSKKITFLQFKFD